MVKEEVNDRQVSRRRAPGRDRGAAPGVPPRLHTARKQLGAQSACLAHRLLQPWHRSPRAPCCSSAAPFSCQPTVTAGGLPTCQPHLLAACSYGIVYFIFVLLGTGTLLPLNVFLTEKEFYDVRFQVKPYNAFVADNFMSLFCMVFNTL